MNTTRRDDAPEASGLFDSHISGSRASTGVSRRLWFMGAPIVLFGLMLGFYQRKTPVEQALARVVERQRTHPADARDRVHVRVLPQDGRPTDGCEPLATVSRPVADITALIPSTLGQTMVRSYSVQPLDASAYLAWRRRQGRDWKEDPLTEGREVLLVRARRDRGNPSTIELLILKKTHQLVSTLIKGDDCRVIIQPVLRPGE